MKFISLEIDFALAKGDKKEKIFRAIFRPANQCAQNPFQVKYISSY